MSEPTDDELATIARAALEVQDYPEDAPIFRALYDAGYRSVLATNPWPALDERYDAAKESSLGSQLRPDELTERVRIELENAFAAGALWQYGRGTQMRPIDPPAPRPDPRPWCDVKIHYCSHWFESECSDDCLAAGTEPHSSQTTEGERNG